MVTYSRGFLAVLSEVCPPQLPKIIHNYSRSHLALVMVCFRNP